MKLKMLNSSLIFFSVITLVCSPVFAGNKSKRTPIPVMGDTPIKDAVRAEIFGGVDGIVRIFPGSTERYKPFGYSISRKYGMPLISFYNVQDKIVRQESLPADQSLLKYDLSELLKKRLTVLPEVATIGVQPSVKSPGGQTVILFDKKNRQIAYVSRLGIVSAHRSNGEELSLEQRLQESDRIFPMLKPNDRLPAFAIERLSKFVSNPNLLKKLRVSKWVSKWPELGKVRYLWAIQKLLNPLLFGC